jgi:hypothetical protein
MGTEAFGSFAGLGVLIFLSCCGYAIVRYVKHRFPGNQMQ